MTKTMQLPHSKFLTITDNFNRDKEAQRKLYNSLVILAYLLDIKPSSSLEKQIKQFNQ